MTQVFVFTAGNPDAQQHLVASIENPIDEKVVFGSFSSADREDLERIREEGNGFYAWGAVPGTGNERNWNYMNRGDYVLCVYDNTYHRAARVLGVYDNKRFAERVWDTDHEGRTWQYMYFLTEPVEVEGGVPALGEYLNRAYFGFTRIHPEKVDAVINQFGTVDEFIHRVLGGPRGGTGARRGFYSVTQQDIEEVEDGEELDRTDVDRETAIIRQRLAEPPRLKEELDPQTRQTRGRARSAAFMIDVKKVYRYQCAICGSGLRTPDGKHEVQSAHIYPKGLVHLHSK